MKRGFVVVALSLALGACGNKKKQEGKEPPVAPDPIPVAGSGSAEAPKDLALVGRGEYLAGMLGCGFCHVGVGPTGPDPAKAYVGGLAIPEKFGTWKAPNITQDKETGIGSWTDEQIANAIRVGTRPDGTQLYPIMPYNNYNRMTDDDAKALVAFLRTLKPVTNKVEANTLQLPKVAPPKPTNAPDPVTDPMKHGEYLVTMMHCDACHTPAGAQGFDRTKLNAGGYEFEIPFLGTGKLYSSNITSDPETGLGKWSVADLEKVIKYMTKPDGTLIQGPMQFYLAGWSKLTDQDVQAIVTFVKAIPPIKNKVPKSTFKPHQGPPPGAGSGSAGAAAPASGSAAKPTGSAGSAAGSAAKPTTGSATPAAGATKPATGSAAGSAAKPPGSVTPTPAPATGSAN